MEGGLVKSALRVLEILELFDAERRPLRVADIVDRMNVPQSSASMLLKTLVARGYMDFDAASREYCPSVRRPCPFIVALASASGRAAATLQALCVRLGGVMKNAHCGAMPAASADRNRRPRRFHSFKSAAAFTICAAHKPLVAVGCHGSGRRPQRQS